jgi:hypothetical protein
LTSSIAATPSSATGTLDSDDNPLANDPSKQLADRVSQDNSDGGTDKYTATDRQTLSNLPTPAPDAGSLDPVDNATLGAIAKAQAGQSSQGNNEPGGYVYPSASGGYDNPVSFGSPGRVDRGSVEDDADQWAVAGWHGHGPHEGTSPYDISNWQNYKPSPGDLQDTYPAENKQLQNAGKLPVGGELREYVIMPDGGVRRYDSPVSNPSRWQPIAPTGAYQW